MWAELMGSSRAFAWTACLSRIHCLSCHRQPAPPADWKWADSVCGTVLHPPVKHRREQVSYYSKCLEEMGSSRSSVRSSESLMCLAWTGFPSLVYVSFHHHEKVQLPRGRNGRWSCFAVNIALACCQCHKGCLGRTALGCGLPTCPMSTV